MKRLFATLMSVAVLAAFTPVSEAQTSCPAEVTKAKELLAKRGSMAKASEAQAPRSLAGARVDQAPRGQDAQAPRGQDAQAPRGQDAQSPRVAAGSTPSSNKATALIKEAEAACKAGDMNTAKAKAEAAIAELK